jgi:hypothetical protein
MHTPIRGQPFGRPDRPVAALSAVAICDAIRIGFLSCSLKQLSADGVFDGNGADSQERQLICCLPRMMIRLAGASER